MFIWLLFGSLAIAGLAVFWNLLDTKEETQDANPNTTISDPANNQASIAPPFTNKNQPESLPKTTEPLKPTNNTSSQESEAKKNNSLIKKSTSQEGKTQNFSATASTSSTKRNHQLSKKEHTLNNSVSDQNPGNFQNSEADNKIVLKEPKKEDSNVHPKLSAPIQPLASLDFVPLDRRTGQPAYCILFYLDTSR